MKSFLISSTFALASVVTSLADSLPSWTEGSPSKKSIIEFVTKVTDQKSDDFVPAYDRIAVFDNDGTLWPENPLPFQLLYAIDDIKSRAEDHPEWQKSEIIKAVIDGDLAKVKAGGKQGLMEILKVTHSGMTTDEYAANVANWAASAQHPKFAVKYTDLTYQPMLEVLDYLRENDFKVYIVSGGGADFMRVWSNEVYGIPPEQVIGSYTDVKAELRDGKYVLVKQPELAHNDDKEGKIVGIHRFIGRRPIACFGNSDGDQAMMQWITDGQSPSFGLYVKHTDGEREYAYDRNPSSSGKFDKALDAAKENDWVVVDMKSEWQRVYSGDVEKK